jgi:hypothetical protein
MDGPQKESLDPTFSSDQQQDPNVLKVCFSATNNHMKGNLVS